LSMSHVFSVFYNSLLDTCRETEETCLAPWLRAAPWRPGWPADSERRQQMACSGQPDVPVALCLVKSPRKALSNRLRACRHSSEEISSRCRESTPDFLSSNRVAIPTVSHPLTVTLFQYNYMLRSEKTIIRPSLQYFL